MSSKAELELRLRIANARVAEDSVIIKNLYLEIDRLRECLKNSSQESKAGKIIEFANSLKSVTEGGALIHPMTMRDKIVKFAQALADTNDSIDTSSCNNIQTKKAASRSRKGL